MGWPGRRATIIAVIAATAETVEIATIAKITAILALQAMPIILLVQLQIQQPISLILQVPVDLMLVDFLILPAIAILLPLMLPAIAILLPLIAPVITILMQAIAILIQATIIPVVPVTVLIDGIHPAQAAAAPIMVQWNQLKC